MPKSRHKPDSQRRNAKRVTRAQQYNSAVRVRVLAEQLQNQAQLDTCLLGEQDAERRLKIFEFMKPFLKFANPQFPSTLRASGIIIPAGVRL